MSPLFLNKAEIPHKINSAYSKDQRITNLLDNTRFKKPLTYERGIWKSCNKIIDLDKKSIYPLCIKRFIHNFKIKHFQSYKINFDKKIEKITETFASAYPSMQLQKSSTALDSIFGTTRVNLRHDIPYFQEDKPKTQVNKEEEIAKSPILTSFLNHMLQDPDIDLTQFAFAQDLHRNPLINHTHRYISIANQDEFYQNGILPALKALSLIVTKDPLTANLLKDKWQKNLDHLALSWINSGSIHEENDDVFAKPLPYIFKAFNRLHTVLTFFAHSSIELEGLLDNLHALDIPDTSLHFDLTDEEAIQLFSDPERDLSSFFEVDSPLRKWPADCQYLMALTLFNLRQDLTLSEKDSDYRSKNIKIIERILNASIPVPIQMLIKASTSDSWLGKKAFDIALSAIESYLSSIQPQEELAHLLEFQKNVPIPPESVPILNQAIAFAKTEKRKQFDNEKIAFLTELKKDVIQGILSKHNEEFNLQELVREGMDINSSLMNDLTLLKDYLNDMTPEKKSLFIASQKKSVLNAFRFIKKHSSLLLAKKNYLLLIHCFDYSIFPNIRESSFLDLEVDPFLPWFQDNVLAAL